MYQGSFGIGKPKIFFLNCIYPRIWVPSPDYVVFARPDPCIVSARAHKHLARGQERGIEVVGMNVTSPTRIIALRTARFVKDKSPSTQIVLGGPHPTIMRETLLERYDGLIDAILCGEGEETFLQLIAALEDGGRPDLVPGLFMHHTEGPPAELLNDLDRYPSPTYSGYKGERYGTLFDTLPVMTARGCPYRCSFCYSKEFWNSRFRCRNIDRVLDEIEYGVRELKLQKVHFNDDIFSVPLERSKAILAGMVYRNLRAQLYCTTRIDCIDDEFLCLFEEAGGGCIYFGIESGSERIRKLMHKKLSEKDILSGVAILRCHPAIRVGFFLIFGYPTETKKDILDTIRLLDQAQPDEVTCNT